jgi:hypothetical protein
MMTTNSMTPADPTSPDPGAVQQEYGELATVYAAKRAETAEALGRDASARQWRKVEQDVQADCEDAKNG